VAGLEIRVAGRGDAGLKGAQLVTVAQSSMISGNQQWKFSS
jgi:hypothetical protein